jgi:hypothetical protein
MEEGGEGMEERVEGVEMGEGETEVVAGFGWPKICESTSSSSDTTRFELSAASTSPDEEGLAYSRTAAGDGIWIALSAFATGEKGERMPGMMMGESGSALAAEAVRGALGGEMVG